MKNIFRILMAVAILLTASCAKEDISSTIGGGEANVTFTVDLPELGTRANNYGDGLTATNLQYYVYEKLSNGSLVELSDLCQKTGQAISGSTTVSLALIKGMNYVITFWAANIDAPYTFDGEKVSIDYSDVNANDEKLDAFFGTKEFNPSVNTDTRVELRRPFAQLNAIVTDFGLVKKSGIKVLTSSEVTVQGYNQFDVLSGDVIGNMQSITFKNAAVPTGEMTNERAHLALNYILVDDKQLVNATFKFYGKYNESDATEKKLAENTYSNVPLQRNYKTNIIGKLLTATTDFNVEILPGFDGEVDKFVSVANAAEFKTAFENANVEGANTEISISDNINLADLITRAADNLAITAKNANLVINGNGYTLTYEGQDRAIDVTNAAVNTNLTLKNVTIDCVASYCQRGVNYNTNGALTLEGVTIKGKNVTYALNLPGSSSNATVTINNSNITGNIALNVWGQDMLINAKDSHFTSVDKTDAEDYVAINLNNDGTTIADGTVVNIEGGSITALDQNGKESTAVSNNSYTGVVNISDTTTVTGKIQNAVAVVLYDGSNEFYSCYTLEEAIEQAKKTPNCTVKLLKDVESSKIIVLDSSLTLDGNGKTLTSTAGRAINVSGADGVTIKDLTIIASGERAINVIQNATNVTIEKVTATAANYTVNVAGSAPEAVVAIKNSTLNGLCTVNVSAAGAQVTIDNSVVNCNDNNTTAGEAYSALSLNKEAVGGSIIATNTTVNVAEGSDSSIARNSAPNGTVTINGSDEEVNVMVAFVTYPNSDYYYSFTTLQDAIDWVAENGEGNIEVIRTIVIDEDVEIDLKGQTVNGTMHKSVGAVIKNNGTLKIKNGTISSTAFNGGSTIANYGTLTVENVTLNGANGGDGSWPSYPVNNYATMTITESSVNGYQGNIACNAAGTTTVNNCTLTKNYFNTSSHSFYIAHAEANVVVNGGTYTHNGMDGSLAYVIAGCITVNDGTFVAQNGGYGMAALTNGKIVINGGNFSKPCLNWGGTIEINGSNLKK